MFGLNMHMDRYDDLDFFDILNDPYQSPDMERESVHAQVEKAYGMWEDSYKNLHLIQL